LSIKQTKPHPWETIEEDYPVGMALEGAVIRILTFGAIIELSEGVTGLLHISQISNDKIRKVEDVLNVGDVVKVRVLEVLKEERKVKLSMKGVEGNESVFVREPGQETPQVEPGSDKDAADSTFVEPEVVESTVVTTEVLAVEDIEPEVVESTVVTTEPLAVEDIEPEVVESTVVTTEPLAVEDVEPEVVETAAPAVENVESTAAEPVPTEEVVRHEETEGPAEA
jgi:ribosomal protein S1